MHCPLALRPPAIGGKPTIAIETQTFSFKPLAVCNPVWTRPAALPERGRAPGDVSADETGASRDSSKSVLSDC